MTQGVDIRVETTMRGQYTGASDLGSAEVEINRTLARRYRPGSTAGKADVFFEDQRVLAGSGSEDLDLSGASLKDRFGQNLAFATIYDILVEADAGNTGFVTVGGAGPNTFLGPFSSVNGKSKLGPGDRAHFTSTAGWDVTAGTGDLLTATNLASGNSNTYRITIIGRSA